MDLPLLSVCIYYARKRLTPQPETINGPGQQTAYSLWFLHEGSSTLHSSTGTRVIRQGELCLSSPGEWMETARRCKIWYICFDLVYRRREPR